MIVPRIRLNKWSSSNSNHPMMTIPTLAIWRRIATCVPDGEMENP